jgi:hypothetical protein
MPQTLTRAAGTIQAGVEDGFQRLVGELARFLPNLRDDHWEAHAVWRPFPHWAARHPDAFTSDVPVFTLPVVPWD